MGEFHQNTVVFMLRQYKTVKHKKKYKMFCMKIYDTFILNELCVTLDYELTRSDETLWLLSREILEFYK